jgi:hypothetical protein
MATPFEMKTCEICGAKIIREWIPGCCGNKFCIDQLMKIRCENMEKGLEYLSTFKISGNDPVPDEFKEEKNDK